MSLKEKARKISAILDEMYPSPRCTLDYEDELQLLVATQLAAQCTDARVNIVTKELFQKYKTVQQYADTELDELIKIIKSTGFYNNKAWNIREAAKVMIKNFEGKVPGNMEALLTIPGVGRKTANVVLGEIFNIPGIIVDTHAGRISRRLGLTNNEDPVKVEKDLMNILPKKNWNRFCHQLVFHGRNLCMAKKPRCEQCKLSTLCEYCKNKIL